MYLILSDVDDNATSSRAFEVFHDGVDVTGEGLHGEGPSEKVCRTRSVGEGHSIRFFFGEARCRKREHGKNLTHDFDTM